MAQHPNARPKITLKTQSGFTLIELIAVIVILGVLAATAVPRFVDLSGSAKTGTREALLGVLESAQTLALAACHTQSTCADGGVFQSVTMGGQSVSMLGLWPQGNANGIARAIDVSNIDITYGSNTVIFTIDTDCTVTYHHPLHGRAPAIAGDDTCA